MPSPLPDSDRLDPRTYHPDLQVVVDEAYRQGIKLTAFPALLRMSQFETVEEAVEYLKHCSEVRSGEPCEPCVKYGQPCSAHNGNSIRCLPCFIIEEKDDCTHQTKMEKMGHLAAPKCYNYVVATKLGLRAVPNDLSWKSKRDQKVLKRALRGSGVAVTGDIEDNDAADGSPDVDVNDVAHETEQPAGQPTNADVGAQDVVAQDAEQPSASADAKAKQRADRVAGVIPWAEQVAALSSSNNDDENIDQLAEDDPPKPTKLKKSSPRKKSNNGRTTAATLDELRSMVQHLVNNSDELLQNSKEILRLQQLRGEESASESEPLAKRRRTDEIETAATSNVAPGAVVNENAAAGPSRAAVQQTAVAGSSSLAL